MPTNCRLCDILLSQDEQDIPANLGGGICTPCFVAGVDAWVKAIDSAPRGQLDAVYIREAQGLLGPDWRREAAT